MWSTPFFFLLFSIFICILSDLLNEDSMVNIQSSHDNLDLLKIPIATVQIITSMSYLADTKDDVRLTFLGSLSSSGVHSLGPLPSGLYNTSVVLHNVIGTLTSISIDKPGYDEWLLASLDCIIDGIYYELSNPNTWLNNYSIELDQEYGNGYTPFVSDSLPASSIIHTVVINSFPLFNADGSLKEKEEL